MSKRLIIFFAFLLFGWAANPICALDDDSDKPGCVFELDEVENYQELEIHTDASPNNNNRHFFSAGAVFSFFIAKERILFSFLNRCAARAEAFGIPLYLRFHSFLFYE